MKNVGSGLDSRMFGNIKPALFRLTGETGQGPWDQLQREKKTNEEKERDPHIFLENEHV